MEPITIVISGLGAGLGGGGAVWYVIKSLRREVALFREELKHEISQVREEIKEDIKEFKTYVKERFQKLEGAIDNLDNEVKGLKNNYHTLDKIQAETLTYLRSKFNNFRIQR